MDLEDDTSDCWGKVFLGQFFQGVFQLSGSMFSPILGKIESELLENTRQFKGGDPMPPCPGNRRPYIVPLVSNPLKKP